MVCLEAGVRWICQGAKTYRENSAFSSQAAASCVSHTLQPSLQAEGQNNYSKTENLPLSLET